MAPAVPESKVRAARLNDAPLSVDAMIAAVSDPVVGGIGLFLGVVRNQDSGQGVVSLDYSHHPRADDALRACAERVAAAHDVVAVAVAHRVGHLRVGELAVVVAIGAVHRAPALAACRQLIDDVKEQVPVWKEQQFETGESQWVGLS